MNDQFTHLNSTQTAISDLKKSGLTPDELLQILDRNDAFVEWLKPRLSEPFGPTIAKRLLPDIIQLRDEIAKYEEKPLDLINYQPLYQLCLDELDRAIVEAENSDKMTPLSQWKRQWLAKDEDGELTLKDTKKNRKLRAVSGVYYDYLRAMQDRSLYDFDDMILRVVHATEVFKDLCYELQEQYHYLMIDEFQDTNDAQMRLVWNLTNSSINEGRPNLLVVGDDDQAIYRFQGAKLSNIIDFRSLYREVAVISLTDNYRSGAPILELARSVIVQGEERLENVIESLDKTLTAHHKPNTPEVNFMNYETAPHEYQGLAEKLAKATKNAPTRRRAVIARRHSQLRELVPYLQTHNVELAYDHQTNVLDLEPIQQLELVARVVELLSRQRAIEANALLPQLLAHPAWQIEPTTVWQLSLDAQRRQVFWLEVMLDSGGRLADIAEWLIISAQRIHYEKLEPMLDWLFGADESQAAESEKEADEPFVSPGSTETFSSPLRSYFFPSDGLETAPAEYLTYLDALRTLRQALREFRPDTDLRLADLLSFIDTHRELNLPIQSTRRIAQAENAVELLSAHQAKGLEYDEIYVIGLSDNLWGESARSRARLVGWPHNLPLGFDTDTTDERLRLLYVALTRARDELHLSTHRQLPSGKASLPVGYLDTGLVELESAEALNQTEELEVAVLEWHAAYQGVKPAEMKRLLTPSLERYRLSPTHLSNFLDVTRGGPELFLLQNLLRFPQAMSASAAYGSSIHSVLQRAHTHFRATGKRRPLEDILGNFEEELARCQLSDIDFELFQKRGAAALSTFLEARYDSFTASQQAECGFSTEDVRLGEVRITGSIDLIDVDDERKLITVTDYKTGKPAPSWRGRTDYEKIKLHHYRQQLLFYKLLLENSRQFSGYTVEKGIIEFIEPDNAGRLHRLELDYDKAELTEFTELMGAVWRRIQALDFSLDNTYGSSLSDIETFERSLLE